MAGRLIFPSIVVLRFPDPQVQEADGNYDHTFRTPKLASTRS